MSKGWVVIAVILSIITLTLFLPVIPVTYVVKEPREKTETYWETVPYETTKTIRKKIIDEKPTIPAGYYYYIRVYIDVSGKKNIIISGKVTETAGYDINFYVFDQKGFNGWKSKQSYTPYVYAKKIKSYSYSFVPDHTDYYYFVLDNGYSLFTNKVPEITATISYEVTYTEYKQIQKTRTVIVYEDVKKTKYVNLLQYIQSITES